MQNLTVTRDWIWSNESTWYVNRPSSYSVSRCDLCWNVVNNSSSLNGFFNCWHHYLRLLNCCYIVIMKSQWSCVMKLEILQATFLFPNWNVCFSLDELFAITKFLAAINGILLCILFVLIINTLQRPHSLMKSWNVLDNYFSSVDNWRNCRKTIQIQIEGIIVFKGEWSYIHYVSKKGSHH